MRQRYPHYINSRAECLEEIPAHWQTSTLGRLGKFFKGSGGTKEDEVEDGIPCVRYGDLYTQHQYLIRETRSGISKDNLSKYTQMHYGDILFAGSGETIEEIGKSAASLIKGPAYCGGDVIVLRPTIKSDATFLGYAADCLTSTYQKALMGRGVTVMHIYSSELKNLVIPLPPLDEQSAIAAFLDHETARINHLIAKHELLIERLAEYRNAVITQTVTKGLPADASRDAGLDPEPRMKSSGSDWIGEVPEHWQIKKLKYAATTNDDVVAESEDPLREILYVDIGSINPSKGMTATEEMVLEDAPSRARRLVQDGDTIVSTVRTYLRAVAPVRNPPPEMVVSTGFAVIRPREIDSGYCSWALREHRFIEEVVANSNGVSYPAINASQIGELSIAVPPITEQRAIAQYLDQKTARIDTLSERAGTAIERLNEYRTALITAAITGKIDVREPSAAE